MLQIILPQYLQVRTKKSMFDVNRCVVLKCVLVDFAGKLIYAFFSLISRGSCSEVGSSFRFDDHIFMFGNPVFDA